MAFRAETINEVLNGMINSIACRIDNISVEMESTLQDTIPTLTQEVAVCSSQAEASDLIVSELTAVMGEDTDTKSLIASSMDSFWASYEDSIQAE